jgi:hypothetical protein
VRLLHATALVACVSAIGHVGCRSVATPSNTKPADAGISIALYDRGGDGYGVVDDRRWVDIAGTSMLLANIDPGAELASLVIEPASDTLRVGRCRRERMPDAPPRDPLDAYAEEQRMRRAAALRRRIESVLNSPTPLVETVDSAEPAASGERFVPAVTCDVTARPGRYLVRVLYVTTTLRYRALHEIAVRDPERAQVTSRFAITTPVWQQRAELRLYDGVPGGELAPREVARGHVALDGSTSVLAVPTRDVQVHIRRVYEGAVVTSTDSTDVMWGHDSVQAIWVWLELAKLRLAPGPIRVHLDLPGEGIRDLDVAQASRKQADRHEATLRLPLWVDESLRGSRQRIIEYNDGASISERLVFGVANTGESAREIFIEEPMRKASKRKLDRAWPAKPTPDGDALRTKIDVRPGRIERAGYSLSYDF